MIGAEFRPSACSGELCVNRFEAVLTADPSATAPWDQVLDESPSFVAFPSLGALVSGWMLIVPRRPMLNLTGLEVSESEELDLFARKVASRLGRREGEPYFFEHGSRTSGGVVGCGVDQAHLHIVPLAFDLIELARASGDGGIEWLPDSFAASFADVLPSGAEYVAITRPRDGKALVGIMHEPRSQWVRRLIAHEIGAPESWNYRDYPQVANLLETVAAYQSL